MEVTVQNCEQTILEDIESCKKTILEDIEFFYRRLRPDDNKSHVEMISAYTNYAKRGNTFKIGSFSASNENSLHALKELHQIICYKADQINDI